MVKLDLPPVVVVSVFGRGLALAEGLREKGIPTVVVDLSHCLGSLSDEEVEGPFPLFFAGQLNDRQAYYWQQPGSRTADGISFLTQEGPLEFVEPWIKQRLDALQMPYALIRERLEDSSLKLPANEFCLDQIWPISFAHYFCSLADLNPAESQRFYSALPFLKKIGVRSAGFYRERLRFLKQSEDSSFKVILGCQIEDISFRDRSTVGGLLIKNERSELQDLSQLVWTLSAAETRFVSEFLYKRIYKGSFFEPKMVWLKWTYKILVKGLPDYFVILNDPELPWSHQNLLVLKRLEQDGMYAVWSLLPAEQRFNRHYLQTETGALSQFFKDRFPFSEALLVQAPTELELTYKDKGPALYATYSQGWIEASVPPAHKYFHSLGYESRRGQDRKSVV